MDQKSSSLEEKISKLAEHTKTFEQQDASGKENPISVEKQVENKNEKSETRSEKLENQKSPNPPLATSQKKVKLAVKTAKDLQGLDKENQVKALVKISFAEGIYLAVEIANNLNDPYILDALHDELSKQFKELVKAGKVKEV